MYKTRDKKDTAFPRGRVATRLIAKHCLWLALLLAGRLPAAAQITDSAIRLSYHGYIDAEPGAAIAGNPELEIFISALDADASVQISAGPHGSFLRWQASFAMLNLDYNNLVQRVASLPRFDRTIALKLQTQWRRFLGDTWGFQASIAPGLAGDINADVLADELFFEGDVLVLRRLGDHWLAGAGSVHTFAFGTPKLLPSLLLLAKLPRYHVDVRLPESAEAWYRSETAFEFGAVVAVTGQRYARKPVGYPALDRPFLQHSVTTAGLGLAYAFDAQFKLILHGGYAFERKLRLVDGNRVRSALDPAAGLYLRTWLIVGDN